MSPQAVDALVTPTAAPAWISPTTGQPMRRLELHVTYVCPERCTFCSEDHRMQAFSAFPVTWGRVARILREQAGRGVEAVHFTGGEPTIHPQFVEILKLAKRLGLRTSIGTIGTRLADPTFAEAVMPNLDEALFSLHGPDAETHDALTRRTGSFDRVLRAISHARRKPGFRPFINTVLTRQNLARLPETVTLARELDASLLIISNVTPEGLGDDGYADLTVRLADLTQAVPAVLDAAGGMIVRFFGLPMCALGPARMHANDLHWNPRVTIEWARHPDRVSLDPIYSWTPDRKREHAAVCMGCSYRSLCFGVFAAYLELHGPAELAPVEAA